MGGAVRTGVSVLGRTCWAVVVLGLGAGVVYAATVHPGEQTGPTAPLAALAPPTAGVLVCPGPLRLPTEHAGDDVSYDPAFDPSPADATSDLVAVTGASGVGGGTGGSGPARLTALAGGEPVAEIPAAAEAGVLARAGGDAGLVLRADPVGDTSPWAAAGVAWRAGTGDLRGLAAASCQRPAATTWLVGGSTVLGSSARLVLQNPGDTPATVSLRMWGARGPVELAGAPDYLVAPGEEEMVLLEGLAAEQDQVVLQVTATGGLVVTYLQDGRTDGLTPAGVDLVVAGAEPATDLMIPAVAVTEDDPVPATVRILAPGQAGTDGADSVGGDGAEVPGGTVHVVLLGPDGPVELPGAAEISVDVGQVIDVPLGDLPPGDYTAWVTSDLPVVAGALTSRPGRGETADGGAPVERAWSPAVAGGLSGPLALPGDEPGRLVLGAAPTQGGTGPVRAEVLALDAEGAVLGRQDVVVPVSGTVSFDLTDLGDGTTRGPRSRATAVVVRTDDPRLAWGAVLDAPGRISVLAPVPQPGARPRVEVTLD